MTSHVRVRANADKLEIRFHPLDGCARWIACLTRAGYILVGRHVHGSVALLTFAKHGGNS